MGSLDRGFGSGGFRATGDMPPRDAKTLPLYYC